jgi:hypothetical protein
MKLSDLIHPSVGTRTDKNVVAAHKLISLIKDKRIREELLTYVGIPTDKLAEYVAAYLTESVVMDADGYDLIKSCGHKIEVKFAFINRTPTAKGHIREEAKIANLNTKTSDLFVFVCDGEKSPTHSDYLRIFSIPYKVWKTKWTGEKGSMSFKSIQHAWYKDYRIDEVKAQLDV